MPCSLHDYSLLCVKIVYRKTFRLFFSFPILWPLFMTRSGAGSEKVFLTKRGKGSRKNRAIAHKKWWWLWDHRTSHHQHRKKEKKEEVPISFPRFLSRRELVPKAASGLFLFVSTLSKRKMGGLPMPRRKEERSQTFSCHTLSSLIIFFK